MHHKRRRKRRRKRRQMLQMMPPLRQVQHCPPRDSLLVRLIGEARFFEARFFDAKHHCTRQKQNLQKPLNFPSRSNQLNENAPTALTSCAASRPSSRNFCWNRCKPKTSTSGSGVPAASIVPMQQMILRVSARLFLAMEERLACRLIANECCNKNTTMQLVCFLARSCHS